MFTNPKLGSSHKVVKRESQLKMSLERVCRAIMHVVSEGMCDALTRSLAEQRPTLELEGIEVLNCHLRVGQAK